jgi:hypothetical protein
MCAQSSRSGDRSLTNVDRAMRIAFILNRRTTGPANRAGNTSA